MNEMTHIDEIFENLDVWRNLPAYQLERRADIFFSIYLPEILSARFGFEIKGIIPEFPIRVGTIQSNADINKSFKVDYLVISKDRRTILLVELKTDEGSRRDNQDWYLGRARQVGLTELLEGLQKIVQATNSKRKYKYLLDLLHEYGLITQINNNTFEIIRAEYDIKIVYIQPNNPDQQDNVVTFPEISEIILKHGDELSLRFSKSLMVWSNIKAGG